MDPEPNAPPKLAKILIVDDLAEKLLVYEAILRDMNLELVMATSIDRSTLYDQRDNRMIPVEVCVINVGYCYDGIMYHSLPPRPPLSLTQVELCDAQEVYEFTTSCNYFRLVLNASEVPADELLAAALNYASGVYATEQERYDFKVMCGRQLALLLSHDLKRLSHLLALIRPN